MLDLITPTPEQLRQSRPRSSGRGRRTGACLLRSRLCAQRNSGRDLAADHWPRRRRRSGDRQVQAGPPARGSARRMWRAIADGGRTPMSEPDAVERQILTTAAARARSGRQAGRHVARPDHGIADRRRLRRCRDWPCVCAIHGAAGFGGIGRIGGAMVGNACRDRRGAVPSTRDRRDARLGNAGRRLASAAPAAESESGSAGGRTYRRQPGACYAVKAAALIVQVGLIIAGAACAALR